MQYYRTRGDSFFDSFTIYPLPYPVLLLLAVIFIFLGGSWYFSYEELVESTESQFGWALLLVPVILIFLVRYEMFSLSRRRTHYQQPPSDGGGSSPWGVAVLIVVLLVLLQYQSAFLDSWFF
ncbi:hypothetical protein LINGRAHAP2_LOCUS26116 [Linum grandiflorum]